MTIKNKTLLIIFVGIACLFAANILSFRELNDAHNDYSSQETLIAHSSAWLTDLDTKFVTGLLAFDPLDGSQRNRDYWNSEIDAFGRTDTVNPLFQALEKDQVERAAQLLNRVFAGPVAESRITYAKVYGADGQVIFCESSLYAVGADPCSPNAIPDYSLQFDDFIDSLYDGPRRHVTTIVDASQEQPLSVNDTLSFTLPGLSENPAAIVVIGRNVIESLEQFSENFEIESALAIGDQVITVHDYYGESRPEILSQLIESAISFGAVQKTFKYSYIEKDLSFRVSSIPFSKQVRPSEFRILIFDDQTELIDALEGAQKLTLIIFLGLSLLILGLVFSVISKSFNRILGSIKALERIREGDLSTSEDEAKGYEGSRTDEVSRLQTTINDYRQHRIEAERENASRAERREKRDQIIFEKMSLLSEQLEGGARRMLRREIAEMRRALSMGNDEQKENVSIELMSRAFSTMSDEVANLIEARTHELVAARDEIGSSIRYAAKLQNALLPSALPTEMEMEVWWRPRDIVGGDIYFIKEYPQKIYIAVIDCTGHGVPGAFLSIIARGHLESATEVESEQTAGEYLSRVNRALRATLTRTDQKNTSDEGFDGGVCIYDRQSRRLSFAGAKSSLFKITDTGTLETKGDRKSVGSSRFSSDFTFTTNNLPDCDGTFVMLTDGITDVMGPGEQPVAFGRRRAIKLMSDTLDSSPSAIVSGVMDGVDAYRGESPYRDDLTLLAFTFRTSEG